MTAHNRKLKAITLELDGDEYQTQVTSWKVNNNTEDGEKVFTFALDGEFREDTDDDYSLDLTFVSDWRDGGISRVLTELDKSTVAFSLSHHPTITAENVVWSGDVVIKAPSAGGDVRTTEMTEVTLQIVGKPDFTPAA